VACIFGAKTPVDLATCGVASLLPGGDLCFQACVVRNSPIEALSAEHAEFDLWNYVGFVDR
jgi:hypothetical protein